MLLVHELLTNCEELTLNSRDSNEAIIVKGNFTNYCFMLFVVSHFKSQKIMKKENCKKIRSLQTSELL